MAKAATNELFPVEVLGEIYCHLVGPRVHKSASDHLPNVISLVRALSTCRFWKHAGLLAPEIWGRMLCVDRQPPQVMKEYLRRSGSHPISIISDEASTIGAVYLMRSRWKIILQQVHRCDIFSVTIRGHSAMWDSEDLASALSTPAPLLQCFTLMDCTYNNTFNIPPHLSTCALILNSPKLQTFQIGGKFAYDPRFHPFHPPTPRSSLTSVSIFGGPDCLTWRADAFIGTPNTVPHWLERIDQVSFSLQSLSLIGVITVGPGQHAYREDPRRLFLPQLESLELGGPFLPIMQLLQALSIPPACRIILAGTMVDFDENDASSHYLDVWDSVRPILPGSFPFATWAVALGWGLNLRGEDASGVVGFQITVSPVTAQNRRQRSTFATGFVPWASSALRHLSDDIQWRNKLRAATSLKIHFDPVLQHSTLPSGSMTDLHHFFQHFALITRLELGRFFPCLYKIATTHYHDDSDEVQYPFPAVKTIAILSSKFPRHTEAMDLSLLWDYLLERQDNTELRNVEKILVVHPSSDYSLLEQDFSREVIVSVNPAASALIFEIVFQHGGRSAAAWARSQIQE